MLASSLRTERSGAPRPAPPGRHSLAAAANIALSVLDEHFVEAWETRWPAWRPLATPPPRRSHPSTLRYADDFVVMVSGSEEMPRGWVDTAAVLSPMGLRLSDEKTTVGHIDEGFAFLGFRIQRQSSEDRTRRSSTAGHARRHPPRSWPRSRRSPHRERTSRSPTSSQINVALRGWTIYFRHSVSKQTFNYLDHYTWHRVVGWLRREHRRATWKSIRRRYRHPGRAGARRRRSCFQPCIGAGDPAPLSRNDDLHPVDRADQDEHGRSMPMGSWRAGCVGRRTSGSGSGPGKRTRGNAGTAPRSDSTSRLLRFEGVWVRGVRFEPDRVVVVVALCRRRPGLP